jgi:hypothetical protein
MCSETFKHIQAPKDFNITALKALLTLLEMNDGLATSIQQGDEAWYVKC